MSTDKGFGKRVAQERRLKGVREERDVLKRDVAADLGVSESTVGRWEEGSLPVRETMERLAAYFGVTVAWLHYGAGPAHPSEGPAGSRPSDLIPAGLQGTELVAWLREHPDALGPEWHIVQHRPRKKAAGDSRRGRRGK